MRNNKFKDWHFIYKAAQRAFESLTVQVRSIASTSFWSIPGIRSIIQCITTRGTLNYKVVCISKIWDIIYNGRWINTLTKNSGGIKIEYKILLNNSIKIWIHLKLSDSEIESSNFVWKILHWPGSAFFFFFFRVITG